MKSIILLCFLLFSGITTTGQIEANLDSAKQSYKLKQYDEAEVLLSSFINDISPSDTTNFTEGYYLEAQINYKKKEYNKSIASYQKLISYLPEGHQKIGDYYWRMGYAYLYIQDYKNFKLVNKKAATAYAKSHGKNDINYTKALNSLGFAYKLTGAYRESEKTLEEARRIKEKNKVFDLQYGKILNQLGEIYTDLNKFLEAEECIQESLKVKKAIKGKNKDFAKTLVYYSRLLQSMGRYGDALKQVDEALKIAEAENIKEATFLDYKQIKASLLNSIKDYQSAANLYEEIKTQRGNLEKDKSSDYAKVLHDLSDIYLKLDHLDKAKIYIEEACQVFKEVSGEAHPNYALAIRKKATILSALGHNEGVEQLYEQSSKIIGRKYSKNHLEYFHSEYAYFLHLKKIKQYSRAITKMENIDAIITEHIVEYSKYLSIQEIVEVTDLYHQYFQEVLSLSSLNPDNEVLTTMAFDCSLFYKGYILETLLSIKKAIRHSNEITSFSEELTELKAQLKKQIEKEEKNNNKIASVQEKIEQVEISIARSLGKIRKEEDKISWEVLQFELTEGEAIIDFVRFKNEKKDDFLYGAMILLPEIESPIFVSLFFESVITNKFKNKLTKSDEFINLLYALPTRGIAPKDKATDISLYNLIWKPIAKHLNGISKVYYVCDGLLHNIALHAIPTTMETVVSDSVQLLKMTSFHSFLRSNTGSPSDQVGKALLIGGVYYGETPDTMPGNNRGAWGELIWTEKEVDAIAAFMKDNEQPFAVLKKDQPSKSALQKTLNSSDPLQIIHFATHGFFYTENLLEIKSDLEINKANLELMNSGLVLAHANELDRKDALLNAFEISELDLRNTELVVLSACETGLGQVYEYEGVYGMQRAFKIAGVEYIIMSLWKVPDRKTKVFMTDFYKNFQKEGLSIPEAFYKTQKQMKNNWLDPIDWAGFVLLK